MSKRFKNNEQELLDLLTHLLARKCQSLHKSQSTQQSTDLMALLGMMEVAARNVHSLKGKRLAAMTDEQLIKRIEKLDPFFQHQFNLVGEWIAEFYLGSKRHGEIFSFMDHCKDRKGKGCRVNVSEDRRGSGQFASDETSPQMPVFGEIFGIKDIIPK